MNATADSKIRPVSVTLRGFNGERVARLTIILANDVPKIIMFDGDPFLIEEDFHLDDLIYVQERPFRAGLGF